MRFIPKTSVLAHILPFLGLLWAFSFAIGLVSNVRKEAKHGPTVGLTFDFTRLLLQGCEKQHDY